MAGVKGVLLLMIPMMMMMLTSSQQPVPPRVYDVGGKDGWVVKPSEGYDHWAQRNRFQVNDTLYFKYNKAIDSVLQVKQQDFDSCNANNPIQKMQDGDSKFKLSNSGLFYFISGNLNNCKNGQKLIVLVMAIRHPPPAGVAPPPATTLPPQTIPSAGLTSPAPSDHSSSGRVGGVSLSVGLGFVLMFIVFVGMF